MQTWDLDNPDTVHGPTGPARKHGLSDDSIRGHVAGLGLRTKMSLGGRRTKACGGPGLIQPWKVFLVVEVFPGPYLGGLGFVPAAAEAGDLLFVVLGSSDDACMEGERGCNVYF